jgi:hypothetical protein
LRKFVDGLGAAESDPTPLATDSKSARDVSYNPEQHNRMKHVARRHFFVRDMVETFELEVPFVRTDKNLADFLTKPMDSAPRFFELRAKIMNETPVIRSPPPTAGGRQNATASRVASRQRGPAVRASYASRVKS